jgi:outer membrane protein TolC
LLVAAGPARGDTVTMSLTQVIALAQQRSSSAAEARNRYRASYWQNHVQEASFLPTLTLHGTVPEFTRSISKLTLPDGREAFVPQSFAGSGLRLSIAKAVRLTGGEVFVESELQRLDLFDHSTPASYLSRPVSVGLRQPLFAFNSYKWQDKIEPLRFEQSRREYVEEMESVAISAAQSFFDLLSAQDQLTMARATCASNETLLAVAQKRRAVGNISEDQLLQTQLASLNAQLDLQRSELDLQARRYQFRSYVGLEEGEEVIPLVTYDVPDIEVDVSTALSNAHVHRSDMVGFDRRVLEAHRDVAEARASGGRGLNLFASYGLSQSTQALNDVFRRGGEQQQFILSLEMPILDWGRSEARRQLAESNRDLALQSVQRSRADFDQDVTMKALQFKVQRDRVTLAATADEIAQRRFEAARKRFTRGEITASDIHLALSEKDYARRNHVDAMRGFWIAYFDLRRSTLFDFETQRPIDYPLFGD